MGLTAANQGREILAERRKVYHSPVMPWLLAATLAGAKMNDDTIARDASTPIETVAPVHGERANQGRRRDRRPRGNRDLAGPPTESAPPSSERPEIEHHEPRPTGPGPSAPPRPPEFKRPRGQQGFGDGIDRQICAFCVPVLPENYPVQGRPGTAVAAYHVIAEIDDRQLLCNELHRGECAWADLTPLDPDEAVSRNWSIVMISSLNQIDEHEPRTPDSTPV
jgi:hypothetical protein